MQCLGVVYRLSNSCSASPGARERGSISSSSVPHVAIANLKVLDTTQGKARVSCRYIFERSHNREMSNNLVCSCPLLTPLSAIRDMPRWKCLRQGALPAGFCTKADNNAVSVIDRRSKITEDSYKYHYLILSKRAMKL
jgi:hypothetical protein